MEARGEIDFVDIAVVVNGEFQFESSRETSCTIMDQNHHLLAAGLLLQSLNMACFYNKAARWVHLNGDRRSFEMNPLTCISFQQRCSVMASDCVLSVC